MSEKICSIILELPKTKQDYLKRNVGEVCKGFDLRKKNCLHMSIEPSFRCSSETFRVSLNGLLKMQAPFDVELDKIDLFENTKDKIGLIYLTTEDQEQVERLTDLYDGVEKIINAKGKPFVPHVSLVDWGPINDVIDAGDVLQTRINSIKLPVGELSLKKKVASQQWEDYGKFSFGGERLSEDDFLQPRLNVI